MVSAHVWCRARTALSVQYGGAAVERVTAVAAVAAVERVQRQVHYLQRYSGRRHMATLLSLPLLFLSLLRLLLLVDGSSVAVRGGAWWAVVPVASNLKPRRRCITEDGASQCSSNLGWLSTHSTHAETVQKQPPYPRMCMYPSTRPHGMYPRTHDARLCPTCSRSPSAACCWIKHLDEPRSVTN